VILSREYPYVNSANTSVNIFFPIPYPACNINETSVYYSGC
jgi:hypothetical protein